MIFNISCHIKCGWEFFEIIICKNVKYITIIFQSTFKRFFKLMITNLIWTVKRKEICINEILRHIYTKEKKIRMADIQNNCIVKIKTINKIQDIIIHKNSNY